jgi:peptidoglycan/LPS O-acetylase OafA/YrhL
MMQSAQGRIKYLDGLRGIAIMLVIFSHYWASAWMTNLSIDPAVGSLRIVRQGWVGVQLFFLISGFVILMTIERCTRSGQFIYKRWMRLFPAMAIATVLTMAFNYSIQPIAKFANTPWYDALPGLTFVSSSFYRVLFQIEIESLHRSFWTLYVEVGFYLFFGVSYFLLGWKRATFLLLLAAAVVLSARPTLVYFGVSGFALRLAEPFDWLGIKFYLWFASGIFFAKAQAQSSEPFFVMACATGLAAALLVSPFPIPLTWDDRYVMLAALILFAAAQRLPKLQLILEWRPLLILGAISYPLYLIHETIGFGLLVLMKQAFPQMPNELLPVPALVIVLGVAYWMTKSAEPALRMAIERLVNRQRSTGTRLV